MTLPSRFGTPFVAEDDAALDNSKHAVERSMALARRTCSLTVAIRELNSRHMVFVEAGTNGKNLLVRLEPWDSRFP